ncbi:pentapeptide repeat-containing protein [Pseudomonas sp. B21128]|uniref:anti-phage Hailong system effector protein HalA n=1 Tax=Pseudomonas sp. B21128 TaxID=3235110 RepID=UPI003784DF96
MDDTTNDSPKPTDRVHGPRTKRIKSYWEPIYDPKFKGTTSVFLWDTRKTTGVKAALCKSETLKKLLSTVGARGWTIKSYGFTDCDFIGHFDPGLAFNSYNFENCDLGSTTWRGTKFTNCTFKKCSFTLATFEQCQFNSCSWTNSGLSGTETKLFDTVVGNPENFINSGYTNSDINVLSQNGSTTPAYQLMRLEETKMKLARAVLSNNERNAEDSVYYESVKVYLLQALKAKQQQLLHQYSNKPNRIRSAGSILLCKLEEFVIGVSGMLNGWGGNLARATFIGIVLMAIFAVAYFILGQPETTPLTWKLALIKSFDITLLVGYTKHATAALGWKTQALYGANALLGLWWYAIFVPTVMNRICRVR